MGADEKLDVGARLIRRRLEIRGQVQGVGFRPAMFRWAQRCQLTGTVANSTFGAVIEVQGPPDRVDAFCDGLAAALPPMAQVADVVRSDCPVVDADSAFAIVASDHDGTDRPAVTPDAATCADCIRELKDPHDRRHGYPFINCTNCGPRYSIIKDIPYDRPATTMSVFPMCAPCQAEYQDPADRRFHAQPNACQVCGPRFRLCTPQKTPLPGDPVAEAAKLLAAGSILAVKGIGGYHLACRADMDATVARLRQRKLRDGKPLAIMVRDLEEASRLVDLDDAGAALLRSPAAPIVLLPKRDDGDLADDVASGCGDLGLMLPYAPVHHLLFDHGLGSLVMTSANISGQPLTYEEDDAYTMLGEVADAFLEHNRAIYRPVDDSVVTLFRGGVLPIRRARGYAPAPIDVGQVSLTSQGQAAAPCILAVGGEMKSAVCLWRGREAILSEHLGELSHPDTFRHFARAIDRLHQLYAFSPEVVAHDLHPDYAATRYAVGMDIPRMAVQHHHAHIAAVMAEHGCRDGVVGLACDGMGLGDDGAVWGCELLYCCRGGFDRIGHLDYYALVGGDAAARQTWRPAASLLHQALGHRWRDEVGALFGSVDSSVVDVFDQQIDKGLNAPPTSSLGRLFDAAAFLLGLCEVNRHEAEGAMAIEAAARSGTGQVLPYELREQDGAWKMSFEGALVELARLRLAGEEVSDLAASFHATLSAMLAEAAMLGCQRQGIDTVALSGGCFANRLLLAGVVDRLASLGLTVLMHRQVPPGDGGLALGQAYVAAWGLAESQQPLGLESE